MIRLDAQDSLNPAALSPNLNMIEQQMYKKYREIPPCFHSDEKEDMELAFSLIKENVKKSFSTD